jgi:hypothetical protein
MVQRFICKSLVTKYTRFHLHAFSNEKSSRLSSLVSRLFYIYSRKILTLKKKVL